MSSPLALIFYESLLIGNQLMNRLQDLGYRVVVISDLTTLPDQAVEAKPLILISELGGLTERVCAAVRSLRAATETHHVPVLGVLKPSDKKTEAGLAEAARAAGFNLVASEQSFLAQLPQLLEQVLEV
jgi:DNA-binding response OmpR family regulator